MSPEYLEIINNGNHSNKLNTEKSDVFSLGITFLRLILIIDE